MNRADELLRRRPEGCLSELSAERYLAGEVDGAALKTVETHLGACAHCGAMVTAMRGVSWRADPAVLREHLEGEPIFARLARWFARPAVLVPAAGLVLVLAAAPLVVRQMIDAGAVREKGGIGLRVFVKTADGSRPAMQGERLRAGDAIKFAVSPGGQRYVMVVNVEETGKVTRYYPRDEQSAPTDPHREAVLPTSITLDDYHGVERVYAVFSDKPLAFGDVAAAVRKAAGPSGRFDPRAVDALPLPFPQASFLISKEQ